MRQLHFAYKGRLKDNNGHIIIFMRKRQRQKQDVKHHV